jgi:hypothetical protein
MRATASGAVAEAYGHKAERIAAPAARSVNTAQVRSGHFGSCLYSGSCSGIGSPNGVLRWLGTDTTEADIRMELACACFAAWRGANASQFPERAGELQASVGKALI